MSEQHEEVERIAIVGLSGRFPGARDLDVFWDNLRRGAEGTSPFEVARVEYRGDVLQFQLELSPTRPDSMSAKLTLTEKIDEFAGIPA